MRLIDANALVESILEERAKIPLTVPAAPYEIVKEKPYEHGNLMRGGIRKALRCVANAPTVDVVPREEYESLLRRFRHLLESEYIRSFDEVERSTGKYKRDIEEAAPVAPVVRCKDCEYYGWEQEPCHGRVTRFCKLHKGLVIVDKETYCSYGKRRVENAAD